jgi:hypothetical protein
MACKVGQKPKILYQFKDGVQRVFQSDLSPIEVIAKAAPVKATANYNRRGYTIQFYSTNNYQTLRLAVVDHYIVEYPGETDPKWKYGIYWLGCNYPIYEGVNVNPNTLIIDNSKGCPSPQKEKSSIIVSAGGRTIFQDQGDAPLSYKIQCGNCPDGQSEMKINKHPGYCCIDCQSVAQEIAALRYAIKRVK